MTILSFCRFIDLDRGADETRDDFATHRPVVGFITREPFLFETPQGIAFAARDHIHASFYGSGSQLPDIITQANMNCLYY